MKRNEQQGLVSILQTSKNYQSRQQQRSITFEGGRGRGERRRGGSTNQSTNQYTKSNAIRKSEPTPPLSAQKD